MTFPLVLSILLVTTTVRAFQYTDLAQYIDSHEEEYVEVKYLIHIYF